MKNAWGILKDTQYMDNFLGLTTTLTFGMALKRAWNSAKARLRKLEVDAKREAAHKKHLHDNEMERRSFFEDELRSQGYVRYAELNIGDTVRIEGYDLLDDQTIVVKKIEEKERHGGPRIEISNADGSIAFCGSTYYMIKMIQAARKAA